MTVGRQDDKRVAHGVVIDAVVVTIEDLVLVLLDQFRYQIDTTPIAIDDVRCVADDLSRISLSCSRAARRRENRGFLFL